MENLVVSIGNRTLYLGLKEGEIYARPYWCGGVDSCLQKEIKVKTVNIIDKNTLEDKEYIITDTDVVLDIDNESKIYYYYMNNDIPLIK